MVRIVVLYEDRGFQWPLKDHYPVYVYTADSRLVAQFTGEFIRHLVEHHLNLAVLQHNLQESVRVLPPRHPLRKSLPAFVREPKVRGELRAKRKQRRSA